MTPIRLLLAARTLLPRSIPSAGGAFAALALLVSITAPARAEAPDSRGWQAFLDRYVVTEGGRKQPLDTRVDYSLAFADNDLFNTDTPVKLNRVRADLLAVPPSQMTDGERLAWAINTYNFLVFERIARHVVVRGKKALVRYGEVSEVVSGGGSFYDTDVVTIEGRGYSLTAFERRFVYGDSTPGGQPRLTRGDPRLMFALSRGSISGPPLMRRAYKADSLEAQLDLATRTALALPRFARPTPDGKQIFVADYLATNAVDFGGIDGVVPFLARWAGKDVRAVIRKTGLVQPQAWLPYDDKINHATRHGSSPVPKD